MNNIQNRLKGSTLPQRIFVFGTLSLVAYTIIALLPTNGESFYAVLHPDNDDWFMDFFNSIFDASFENPYTERGNIYPALCFIFYRFFGALMNQDYKKAADWGVDQYGVMIYLALVIVTCLVIYNMIRQKDKHSLAEKIFPALLLFGTVPFWYCYERGNIILQTLMFLLIFIRYYRSENKFLRELALISLAIAASIKIYPVLFGLLLLKERKWKESLRCIIYGCLFFVLPFFLIDGIESIKAMLNNIFSTDAKFSTRGFGYKLNIDNTVAYIQYLFKLHGVVPKALYFVPVTISVGTVILLSRDNWKIQAAIASSMILLTGFSYTYSMLYMVLPLVSFFESGSKRKIDSFYMILFVCMFAPFSFGGYDAFNLNQTVLYPLGLTTVVSSIAIVIFIFILSFDTIVSFIKKIKN